MRNYFKDGLEAIKKALLQDTVNLYLLSFTIILALASFIIWRFSINSQNMFVYSHLGIFPLRYLVIVLILNCVLGLFSYEKEKEICYLFLSANVMLSLFLLVLEAYYLLQN